MMNLDHTSPDNSPHRTFDQVQPILASYPIDVVRATFVQHNAGVVYRVDARQGAFMLKLHHRVGAGTNLSVEQIEDGMDWLAHMAHRTGLVVQTPILNRSGRYVTQSRGNDGTVLNATLQRWVEGQPPQSDFTHDQLREIGRTMARLHDDSAAHPVQSSTPSLRHDAAALRDEVATLRTMLVPDVVTPDRFVLIERAAEHILRLMSDLGTAPDVWGVVHGDVHHDNVLFEGDRVRLIDWTSVRLGYYMYDLGVTVYHINYREPAARRALLDGYAEVRALPADHLHILAAMATFAALGNLAWNSTITTQLNAPLFRKNVAHFVDGYCAALVAGRSE